MGQVQFDAKTQELTITYGGEGVPWSGIDTSQPDAYISPAGLVWGSYWGGSSYNGIAIDNSMRALCWQSVQAFSVTPATFIGMGDLLGLVFFVAYNASTQSVTVYTVSPFPGGTPTPISGSPLALPNYIGSDGCAAQVSGPGTLTFKNINGKCYFSWPGLPYILQWQPNVMQGVNQLNVLTSYLGASYLNELNGVLLAMDVWQFTQSGGTGGGSGGGTSVTPTYPNGNASATFTGTGTAGGSIKVNSTPVATFPSTPIAANTSVELTVNLSGQANYYEGGITWGMEYSVNGGTNWNTWISYGTTGSTGSQSLNRSGVQLTIPNSAGITNLNQLQIRAYCVAGAGATGNANGNIVYASLTTSYVPLGTGGGCSSSSVQRFPYQFAWSAPQGQYGQFNSLVNGLQTGAGYNNLPDVEDTITGYFNVGPTGYILRTQGITIVSPLNSGIEPFDFNHLWASHKGIGTIYPQTVSQYGSKGIFLSDVGIFTIGYEGLATIDNKAKSAIYGELQIIDQANLICGGLGPLQLDGNNFLAYVIAAYNNSHQIVTYIFNFSTNEWYRILFDSAFATSSGMQVLSIQRTLTASTINSLFFVNYPPDGTGTEIAALPLMSGIIPEVDPNVNSANWVFKTEEVVPGRDITIDGIFVNYKGQVPTGSLLVQFIVGSGVAEGQYITYIPNNNYAWTWGQGWQYILLTPQNSSPFMGKYPYLNVLVVAEPGSSNCNFELGKVVLYGSVDTEQRPV